MSVLIKGMDMPTSCWECEICSLSERLKYKESRNPNCPLVEIPTPHGRLIDADDSMKHLADDGREAFTKSQVWLMFSEYGAPTILEAEE